MCNANPRQWSRVSCPAPIATGGITITFLNEPDSAKLGISATGGHSKDIFAVKSLVV